MVSFDEAVESIESSVFELLDTIRPSFIVCEEDRNEWANECIRQNSGRASAFYFNHRRDETFDANERIRAAEMVVASKIYDQLAKEPHRAVKCEMMSVVKEQFLHKLKKKAPIDNVLEINVEREKKVEEGRTRKTKKNVKKLLKKAEKKGTSSDQEHRWNMAMMKADGEKLVADDARSLRRLLKSKENSKKRSQKQWNERLERVRQAKDERQKRKAENIRKRREKSKKG